MVTRSNLKIGRQLEAPETKKSLNEVMFDEIAPRYDFITRALSFWRDAAWKRAMVAELPAKTAPVCLDLASGTGDIAFLLAEKYPLGDITGVDLSDQMLIIADQYNWYPNVTFLKGDMEHLSAARHSVDIITGGYALRNAPDLNATLAEIDRVLKPGGIAAFLDFSKPKSKTLQRLEYLVLKAWTGLWGVLLHRNHEVYSYIAESLRKYPDRKTLKGKLRRRGFAIIVSELNFLGITEILIVRKS